MTDKYDYPKFVTYYEHEIENLKKEAYQQGLKDALKRLPIDQAPKDGTPVLGFYEGWELPKLIGWNAGWLTWKFSDYITTGFTRDDANDATHFMYIAGE